MPAKTTGGRSEGDVKFISPGTDPSGWRRVNTSNLPQTPFPGRPKAPKPQMEYPDTPKTKAGTKQRPGDTGPRAHKAGLTKYK